MPYGGRSDLRRWAKLSISAAGQEDKAVEQTESLEEGEAALPRILPYLDHPWMGRERLNLSREDAQIGVGRAGSQPDEAEPDTWQCLLPKIEVTFWDVDQAVKMLEATEANPHCTDGETGEGGQKQGPGRE